ncbi:MAG TPA: ribbon-helix-helix protein, CopG family, partial [Natrialbaceae archaeon]|nr:ribbon-helix-helix protein, CopG family [Natrialbaceae archaeon]
MADELERISLTLPPEMVEELDRIVDDWDYASRSKAIRDALREFFTTHSWESDDPGRHYGTVTVLHEHEHGTDLHDRLNSIQHEMADLITSVQHIHLSHDACMETLIVNGPGRHITELANR